jgi:hypothetical protein
MNRMHSITSNRAEALRPIQHVNICSFFFYFLFYIKLIKYSIISNQFTVYENNNCNQTHLEKHHKNKKMSRDLTETESNEASIKLNLKIIDEPKVLIFCFCKL